MKIEGISPGYERYLKDESRVEGKAESICFPETVSDAVEAVRRAYKEKVQITVQGARTGLTGAAVPEKGSILNFSKMKGELKFNEDGSLYAEAGVTLKEIHDYLRKSKVCFLPNPTEDTAAIGGMFGCNAMGIDGRDTASSVLGLRWINGKGDLWEIKRGSYIFDKQGC
ncbi:MAG: FAD-binding oxidoreductase, partial [Eubacterium sp.]